MISNNIHTLYQINKGGIKTACVEFVEFDGSDNLKVATYKLKGVDGRFSLLPHGKPQWVNREVARAMYKSVKEAGYQTIA
jgi:hypothetical protein